jgi:hypothetical protein
LVVFAAVLVIFFSSPATIPKGYTRYSYRVSWEILNGIKNTRDPICDQDIDMILDGISDSDAKAWALEWRHKNLIYLFSHGEVEYVILDPRDNTWKGKKVFLTVLQKNYESPRFLEISETPKQ